MPLQQTIKLQQEASNPKYSVFVSASAGSGKTKILTDRVLRMLLLGIIPSKILCLTFTKVAAAEMQNRIYSELSLWVCLSQDQLQQRIFKLTGSHSSIKKLEKTRTLFATILDDLEGIRISTIHSFCQNLMKKFPIEAKINPNFQIIDEQTENKLLNEARNKLLKSALTDRDLADRIKWITSSLNESSFLEITLELIKKRELLTTLKEKYINIEGLISEVYQTLDYHKNNIQDVDSQSLLLLCEHMKSGTEKTDQKNCQIILKYLDNPTEENFDLYKNVFLNAQEEPKNIKPGIITTKILNSYPEAEKILLREQETVSRIVDRLNSIQIAKSTDNLLFVTDKIIEIYSSLKSQNGYMDYTDLISKTSHLLQNSQNAQWIKYKLDGSVEHILIDESQDTNHYQWSIVKAITDDFFSGSNATSKERTIFVVGDEKQSIYSFQGANPSIFSDIYHYYQEKLLDADDQIKDIQLNNSFRSLKAILDSVDMVFSNTQYQQAISKLKEVSHKAINNEYYGTVEVWPIISINQYKKEQDKYKWQLNFEPTNNYKSKELLAKTIAKTIRKWIDNKKVLKSANRLLEYGDVMILLKNRTNNLGNLLVKYLQEEKIPVRGNDKIKLSQNIIIKDLLALAKFTLLPKDDLNLASLLKSPLIGISEEDLLDLCLKKNKDNLGLFDSIKAADKFRDQHYYLSDIIEQSGKYQHRIYEFFSYILEIKPGRKNIIQRFGVEAEEIINQFLILCLTYQNNNITSLENFVCSIDDLELEVKIDLSHQNFNEVKITTIHSAKGLESPIVFIADAAHKISDQYGRGDKVIWANNKYNNLPLWPAGKSNKLLKESKRSSKLLAKEEYLRLLYVAMTRAADELYITGFEDKYSDDCWYSIIKNSISTKAKNKNFDFHKLLDIENLNDSEDLGLSLQKDSEERKEINLVNKDFFETPKPSNSTSEYSSTFSTSKNQKFLQQDSLSKDDKCHEIIHKELFEEIIYPSQTNNNPLNNPEHENKGFSQYYSPSKDGKWSDFEFNPKYNRGKVIHKILEILPNIDSKNKEKRDLLITEYLIKNLITDKNEQELILKQTSNILDNEEFNYLFNKNSKAEVPIIGKIDGKIISGRIDRLVITDEEAIIIDYKTNQDPSPILNSEHKNQLLLYKKLMKKIYPDKKVRCAIVWTSVAKISFLEDC